MKMEQIRKMWAPTSGKVSPDWLMGRESTNPVMPAPTNRSAPEIQTRAKMKHNENRRWKIRFFLGRFPSKAHVFFFFSGGWVENFASPVGRKIGPPKHPSQLGLLLFRRASSRSSKIMKQLKLTFFTPTDQYCGEHGGTWFCGRCLVETSDRFTDRLGSELKWADGKPLQCRQWCRIIPPCKVPPWQVKPSYGRIKGTIMVNNPTLRFYFSWSTLDGGRTRIVIWSDLPWNFCDFG